MRERKRDVLSDQRRTPTFSRVVEGRPITVHNRELVPLVRVTRFVKRRATLRGDKVGARGYGFVHMRPVGVVERDGADRRRHAIRDETTRTLWMLALVVLLVPCLSMLLIHRQRRIVQTEPSTRAV